ncbi:hypothetical protein K439DRAFT_564357 [Ramaria rubella]|nr:hypothetical protein K439DRAFT_564357 [Ramaria rubella]
MRPATSESASCGCAVSVSGDERVRIVPGDLGFLRALDFADRAHAACPAVCAARAGAEAEGGRGKKLRACYVDARVVVSRVLSGRLRGENGRGRVRGRHGALCSAAKMRYEQKRGTHRSPLHVRIERFRAWSMVPALAPRRRHANNLQCTQKSASVTSNKQRHPQRHRQHHRQCQCAPPWLEHPHSPCQHSSTLRARRPCVVDAHEGILWLQVVWMTRHWRCM